MSDRPHDPDNEADVDVRRTVERLEATTQLDDDDLRSTFREYRKKRRNGEAEEFLDYLYERELIDEETYVTASNEQPVELEESAFEHLPPREPFYELHETFDEGGMGEICVGHDPHLDRRVAVKILRAEKSDSDLERRRFLREAQVTGKLAHPNIVPVHSLHAEAGDRASFAMKLVDGRTLFDLIQEAKTKAKHGEDLDGPLAFRRRVELFLRVCDAMAYAHDRGVIHRDLKPSNIMVGAYNEVYVMDWGIAKILDQPTEEDDTLWASQWEEIDEDEEVKTQAGSLIGTPPYMPPEQAEGEHETLDARSDLFSLSAILFELVTLRRLIPGTKVFDVLQNVMEGNHNPYEARADGESIDAEMQAIIERGTARNQADRYQSVDEMAEDVRRYLDNREVSVHPDGPIRKAQRWMQHNRDKALSLLAITIFLGAAVAIWALWSRYEAVQSNRQREAKLSKLQTEVSNRSHTIDQQFLRFELLADRMSTTARRLLADDPNYTGPLYGSDDFDAADTAPPAADRSPLYDKRISLQTPVYKLAPGVEIGTVEPQIRKLMALRTQFRSVFLESRLTADDQPRDARALWQQLAVDGVPARWAYVATEQGLHFSYPGKGGYPADYDPRERPWYEVGKQRGRLAWAPPYPDAQGQGLVMPCVSPVRSRNGEFLGVAGLEVTLDFIEQHFMKPEGPIASTYVLDSEGRILVTSNGTNTSGQGELPSFHVAPVLEMVRRDASGFHKAAGTPTDVYAVSRMPTLDWFYVARAPMPELLEWGSPR